VAVMSGGGPGLQEEEQAGQVGHQGCGAVDRNCRRGQGKPWVVLYGEQWIEIAGVDKANHGWYCIVSSL
jgi:hypothetical protein